MKKLLFFLPVLLVSNSCNNDDNDVDADSNLLQIELTKNFLLDEKWFFESITSDDITSEVVACDLDSFYQFERRQDDVAVLDDAANECSDFSDRYGDSPLSAFPFTIDAEKKELFFDTGTLQMLGGVVTPVALSNVQFLLSKDYSYKLIKADIAITNETTSFSAEYVLKATFDNKPE